MWIFLPCLYIDISRNFLFYIKSIRKLNKYAEGRIQDFFRRGRRAKGDIIIWITKNIQQ